MTGTQLQEHRNGILQERHYWALELGLTQGRALVAARAALAAKYMFRAFEREGLVPYGSRWALVKKER